MTTAWVARLRADSTLIAILAAMLFAAAPARAELSPKEIFAAIVEVNAEVPRDARTAATLGTERTGSGVIIDSNGTVLTIGWLILEAARVHIVDSDGKQRPTRIVAYDWETGFGLLQMLAPPDIKPIRLGSASSLAESDQVLIAAFGGTSAAQPGYVVSRREFAGYWEYLLEDAIFTVPFNDSFSGAALIGRDGKLLGIGYLAVGDAGGKGEPMPGNMFVPIDRLKPVLADLLELGRSGGPAKPWLGLYTEEERDRVFVTRVARDGPAERADIKTGAIVLRVAGKPVTSQADFYKKVWALGEAGADVPLTLLDGADLREVILRSSDRYKWLKLGPSN